MHQEVSQAVNLVGHNPEQYPGLFVWLIASKPSSSILLLLAISVYAIYCWRSQKRMRATTAMRIIAGCASGLSTIALLLLAFLPLFASTSWFSENALVLIRSMSVIFLIAAVHHFVPLFNTIQKLRRKTAKG